MRQYAPLPSAMKRRVVFYSLLVPPCHLQCIVLSSIVTGFTGVCLSRRLHFLMHFISCSSSCILTVTFNRRGVVPFADEFFQTKSSYALNGFGNFRSFYRDEDGGLLLLQLYHRLCSGFPLLHPRSHPGYEKI